MFGVPASKIIENKDLNSEQRAKAQQFIKENSKQLINMLPEGHTVSGKATGVQPTLLNQFYTKGERLSDEVEAGVGTQNIIDGTGKWKTFIGSNCTYGIKYKDDVVLASQKCKTLL